MHGIQEKLIRLINSVNEKSEAAVRQDNKTIEWFRTSAGVQQGCTLSPDLLNLVLEAVMRLAQEKEEEEAEDCGRLDNNLRFADDINLMSKTQSGLQQITYNASLKEESLWPPQ